MNERIEQELFPFYALDALTPAERAEVEAYTAADPEAKARLDALMNTTDKLPYDIEPIAPSPEVKANLMARIQADKQAQTAVTPGPARATAKSVSGGERLRARLRGWYGRLRTHPALPALAGVCLLLAVFALGWGVRQSRQQAALQTQITDLSTEVTALRGEKDALQIQNAALRQQIENQEQRLAAYQQPGTITLAIGDATGSHPEATGTLTIDTATETAVFVAENLAQLDETQVYQLWLIRGETPVSAGLFNVDETGRGVLVDVTAVPGSFEAIGLTIEPAGGSPSPTLDQLILLGAMSS